MGYSARHVVETGHINTDDFEILKFAEHSGEVILTHDTDFGMLLALHGKSKPSVILFRLEQISTLILLKLLKDNLPNLMKELTEGSIVIIEVHGIRIRKLPVMR